MMRLRIRAAIEDVLRLWRLNRIGVVRPADFKLICDSFEELKEVLDEAKKKPAGRA